MMRRHALVWASGLFLVLASVLAGCGPATPPVADIPPPPVTVSQPVVRMVTDHDQYDGRIGAAQKVEVRARVQGHLKKVHFEAGQMVKAGDLLYEIDPRTYKAALDAARAQQKSAEANLKFARAEYERTRYLVSKGAATREDLESWAAKEAVARSDVLKGQSSVEKAQLDVDFTRVTAPFDGKISRTQVDVGNLINAGGGETLLTTIVSVNPMHVYFTVDERSLLRYRRMFRGDGEAAGKQAPGHPVLGASTVGLLGSSSAQGPFLAAAALFPDRTLPPLKDLNIPVEVALEGETGYPHKGVLDFADNRVNPNTGTILARGVLANTGLFEDGMRARVQVPVGDAHKVVMVTERAVGNDQGRKFVYVVNEQNVVERRDVTPGRLIDGMLVIERGLKPDEWIVVNGIQRVRDGLTVRPQRRPMPDADRPAEPAPKAPRK